MLKRILFLALAALAVSSLRADPLSKKTDIDFFRDVPSRNLKGLATRSDGRLVAGPTFSELDVKAPADLLWYLAPGADATHWLVGTGPEGKIVEVTFNPADATYAARDLAKLEDSHVFSLIRLADGAILAGTAPRGALYLVRDGKPVTRVLLPADSIIDLALLDEHTALAGTGNPGRVYRVDLAKFATAGVSGDKITDAKQLTDRGLTQFGEVRDRNVRRLAVLTDGRVIVGSSPKGNVYAFAHDGGAPIILQENQNAEVTDLLPQPNGEFFAAIAYSPTSGESRVNANNAKSGDNKPAADVPPPSSSEKFAGRSSLVSFPASGFPETLVTRQGAAFYHLARHDDLVVIAGGEAGELLGYSLKTRFAFTYAGSVSAQLSGMAPIPGASGKFLLLRNNVPGFALLDFNATGPRDAETRRLDLGNPAQLGAVRFNRLRDVTDSQLTLELKTSNGSDEIEGWTPWTPLASSGDGWRAPATLRGRYVKLRVRVATAAPATTEIDKAALFMLPQNHRPVLQEFRVLTPNFGIVPAVEQPPPAVVTYGQVLNAAPRDDDAKRKSTLSNSQIVPAPGTQVVFWTVTDPDGDNVTCTFSVRREGETTWTDIATNTRDGFAQFETSHMPDGVYFTRLVATEAAPRPIGDRLTATFETDDLLVDHTPPEFIEVGAKQDWQKITITAHGRDKLSLLEGIEVTFNNGYHETLEQPDDGVRDSREETFTLDVPVAKVAGATSAEVTLYDAAGNAVTRRVKW